MTRPDEHGEIAWRESLRIDAGHPALPGHFPGRPVVPGVVVLDRIVAAIERRLGRTVQALPQVKFQQPLLPGEEAELVFSAGAGRVRFSVTRNGSAIAGGSCELRA